MPDKIVTPSVRTLLAVFVLVLAVLLSPTVAEFIVALVNKYRVYPEGTDTNMYAYTTIVQMLLVFFGSLMFVWPFMKRMNKVFFGILFIFCCMWLSMFVPSFIPENWCKQELRIYSCESGIRYQR